LVCASRHPILEETLIHPPYCTLALTDAAPFNVKVQLALLFPLLEQAPDQMA